MMKATKLFLLILFCYCSVQVYSQGKAASWLPDSLVAQIPLVEKQAADWKQKTIENPKDEKAWLCYAQTVQMLRGLTPGDSVEKEKTEIIDRMKQNIPNTATYAIVRNLMAKTPEERSMPFEEIMEKWPDAVLHYPTYMGISMMTEGDKLKDLAIRWYKSGTFPAESLNFAYNELASADKNALIFVNAGPDAFGSYILQYAKEQFKDKRIVVLPFLFTSDYMNKLTQELGIPEFKEELPDSDNKQSFSMTHLYDEFRSRVNHLIKHSQRPVYFSISTDESMRGFFKEYLHAEGLLMKYSEKPYDNLAIMRRNFENTYLMDYIKETFYPETMVPTIMDTKASEALNLYYVPAFRSLLQFYKESDDLTYYDKLYQLLESIVKDYKFSDEVMRKKYMRSIQIQ